MTATCSAERSATSDKGSSVAIQAETWRTVLAQIPSVFGRMIYLASTCTKTTCQHARSGVSQVEGPEEALCESHRKAFAEWLGLNREEQAADLKLYLSGLATERGAVVRVWARLEPYRNLVPVSALRVEQGLFIAGLAALLKTLIRESADPLRR